MIDNLRLIRAFLAVARIGNFTRTAAELRMSQSTLTVQIKQLESDLGALLFDRGKRRVTLTQVGQDLLVPLERILVDAEEIVSRTQQLAGLRRGIISLAVLPSLASKLIPLSVRRFSDLHPGIVVQIHDIVAEKIIDAVKRGDVDFGVSWRQRRDRELKTVPLLVDRLCAFVPSDHLLAAQSDVTLQRALSFPLILTGRDSSVREIVEAALKRQALTVSLSFETNYMSTALGLVGAGMGIAILPESAAGTGSNTGIKRLPIDKPELSRKIDLIFRKDRSLSPAALKMVEIIQKSSRGEGL